MEAETQMSYPTVICTCGHKMKLEHEQNPNDHEIRELIFTCPKCNNWYSGEFGVAKNIEGR